MREVKITITTCEKCPHFDARRVYTADSFEMPFKWICKHGGTERVINGFVEWHDDIEIPVWCPFNEDNLNKKV